MTIWALVESLGSGAFMAEIRVDRGSWGDIYTDSDVWRLVVEMILARHELGRLVTLRGGYPGSHAVFIVNETLVVKIYAPFWGEVAPLERALLQVLGDAAIVAVPHAVAVGDFEAAGHCWPYLVMSFLPGERLGDHWGQIHPANRGALAAQLGHLLGRLHALSPDTLLDDGTPLRGCFPGLRQAWPDFVQHQRQHVQRHHAARDSLPGAMLAQLPAYLDGVYPWLVGVAGNQAGGVYPWQATVVQEPEPQEVLLHGDVTADHLLIQQDEGGVWHLTGLIDFGDARLGHPLYEFVAITADFMHTTPEALPQLLAGYGWAGAQHNPHFRHQLTALALLHECADMRPLTEYLGGHPMHSDLSQFEAVLCGPLP